jgi:hypothetical protein
MSCELAGYDVLEEHRWKGQKAQTLTDQSAVDQEEGSVAD